MRQLQPRALENRDTARGGCTDTDGLSCCDTETVPFLRFDIKEQGRREIDIKKKVTQASPESQFCCCHPSKLGLFLS